LDSPRILDSPQQKAAVPRRVVVREWAGWHIGRFAIVQLGGVRQGRR